MANLDVERFLYNLNFQYQNGNFDLVCITEICDKWQCFVSEKLLIRTAKHLVSIWNPIKESNDKKQIWKVIDDIGCVDNVCNKHVVLELLKHVKLEEFNSYIGLQDDFPYQIRLTPTGEQNTTRLWPIISDLTFYLHALLDSKLLQGQSLKWVIYNQIVNLESLHLKYTLRRACKTNPKFVWEDISDDLFCKAMLKWSSHEADNGELSYELIKFILKKGFASARLLKVITMAQEVEPLDVSCLVDQWKHIDEDICLSDDSSDCDSN